MMIALIVSSVLASCAKPNTIYLHEVSVVNAQGLVVPHKYNYDTVYVHDHWEDHVDLSSEELDVIRDIYVHQSFGGTDVQVKFTGITSEE